MDGIEVCEEIRKIPSLSRTTIAFLTARGEDYSQIAGFGAGGDDYITKPVKIYVLTSRIKALLKRSQQCLKDEKNLVHNISDEIVLDRGIGPGLTSIFRIVHNKISLCLQQVDRV